MEIEIKQLSFGYRQHDTVLNDLNFTWTDEEVIALIGASGSGKSTFLRILSGIITKQRSNHFSGEVLVDKDSPLCYTQRGKTSFMFQEPALFPNLSVLENIKFRLSLDRKVDAEQRAREVMQFVGLTEFSAFLPHELSGGMKTRVELARCFANQPDLLLLDEPFGSLDIRWRWKLYREIELLKKQRPVKIMLVTHDIQEALLLADRVMVLSKKGALLKDVSLNKWLGEPLTAPHLESIQPTVTMLQELILNEHE